MISLDFGVSQILPFSEYEVKRVGERDSGASDEKNGGNVSLVPTISWCTLPFIRSLLSSSKQTTESQVSHITYHFQNLMYSLYALVELSTPFYVYSVKYLTLESILSVYSVYVLFIYSEISNLFYEFL